MEPVHRAQTSEQLQLYEAARARPKWENLPPRVRQEVVRLLEKIFVDCGCRAIGSSRAETGASDE